MDLLDIHTHHIPQHPFQAILNCKLSDIPFPAGNCSVGIHPWYLTKENLQQQMDWVTMFVQTNFRVLAIGEAGLDKAVDVPFDLQLNAFRQIIEFAGKVNLPLIIHAVRTSNEMIALKKEYSPRNPWIIHGFRGKKELAAEYVKHGFYLSFGERYREDALQVTPLNRIFFETDESLISIHTLYEKAAQTLSLPYNQLLTVVKQNMEEVFFKR